MKKINLGKSRYGDIRELHELETGKYSTEGFKKVQHMRVGERKDEEEGFQFYDPDGGPFISVGMKLINQTITHIKFEEGRYVIYTDKHENNSIDEPQDRVEV